MKLILSCLIFLLFSWYIEKLVISFNLIIYLPTLCIEEGTSSNFADHILYKKHNVFTDSKTNIHDNNSACH